MISPTARAVILAALGAPIALALTLAGGVAWLGGVAWTLGVCGAVLADAALGADRSRLALELEAPAGLAVGRRAAARILARFKGRPPLRVEYALETSANLQATPSGADGAFVLAPVRRGQAAAPRLWARWRGPLGLAVKQRSEPCAWSAPITVDIVQVKEDAARLISNNPLFGARLQFDKGGASEFHALADYQPGMDRRAVDWKQSARHGSLLVREFEAERNHHVVLAIDGGRQMCEPIDGQPRVDRALQAGLLLAFGALKAGDRVGLFAFDERPRLWSGALAGRGAFDQLQRLSAAIDYSTAETNYTLGLTALGAHLQRRSLVVVFTEFTDSTTAELMLDNIARLLRTHHVLFVVLEDQELSDLEGAPIDTTADVTRAVLAGALARQRELVISRLRRMGADILHTRPDRLGPELLARYTALKQGIGL